jgi:hypothetical protein
VRRGDHRARRARTPPSAMAESRGAAKRAAVARDDLDSGPADPSLRDMYVRVQRADSRSAQHACFQRLPDATSRPPEPTPTR